MQLLPRKKDEEKNKPCIYESGSTIVKGEPVVTSLAENFAARALHLPSFSRNVTLLDELRSCYDSLWNGNQACWSFGRAISTTQGQQYAATVDYQHGLSQMMTITIDSLVSRAATCLEKYRTKLQDKGLTMRPSMASALQAVESLPFGNRLQVPRTTVSPYQGHLLDDFDFANHSQSSQSKYSEAELLRHAELYNLAFASHPFLSTIVSRTLFLASVDDKEHNRVLYDAILIAGHGLKEKVSFHPRGTDTEPYGLPDLDCLIRRTTNALYKTKLGGLKSAGVQTCVQASMLLAWHELALGLVRRASTWWSFIRGLILKIRYLREKEDSYGCSVNGIDKRSIVDEELGNMHTVSQLVVLWFDQHFGPISLQHPLNPFLTSVHVTATTQSSLIGALDKSMGKISASEGYARSCALLCRIERILPSLVAIHGDAKMSNAQWTSTAGIERALDNKVSAILAQAGASESDLTAETISASVVSFTALLACFSSRESTTRIGQQRAKNMISACACVALHLRGPFGSPSSTVDNMMSNHSSSTRASMEEGMNECLVALTMIETVAFLFECLLASTDPGENSDADYSDQDEGRYRLNLTNEAKQVVGHKLGEIMAILCTLIDCFDNIPKRGKRANHISWLLGHLHKRLEGLSVLPDVSFALEISKRSMEPSQVTAGESCVGLVPAGTVPLHCASIPAMMTSTQHSPVTPPPTFGAVPPDNAFHVSYDAPLYSNQHGPPPPPGRVGYGPGPIQMGRNSSHDGGGMINIMYSHGTWCPEDRFADQARAPRYWEPLNLLGMEMMASTANESPTAAAAFTDGPRQFGQGIVEPVHPYDSGGGTLRVIHGCSDSRLMSTVPSHTSHMAEMDRQGLETYATQEQRAWMRHEPWRDRSTPSRNACEAHGVEPRNKRARVEAPMSRQVFSMSTEVVRSGEVASVGCQSSNGNDVVSYESTRVMVRSQRRMASVDTQTAHPSLGVYSSMMPAAEALASIQRIEPLTEDMHVNVPAGIQRTRKRERACNEPSFSAKITSLCEEESSDEEEKESEKEGDDVDGEYEVDDEAEDNDEVERIGTIEHTSQRS
ncbi:uncharacterized protein UTRI_05784 [Ustilago trichophora]|uniref:Transcription factor domain-containing protein n=1 Tax=Ustilago trichophora TaxID=86804 RepID=A0A5C3EJI0_9BASI|nr:uncharacterized protein UTRI_05784 [Ustilago trichophora]